jgi:hypothetical protein
MCRRLSGPQPCSGRVRKISPPTGIRSPGRAARRESLYRLSYPGPLLLRRVLLKLREFDGKMSRKCDLFVPGLQVPSAGRVLQGQKHFYGVKRCVMLAIGLETLPCPHLVSSTRRKSC